MKLTFFWDEETKEIIVNNDDLSEIEEALDNHQPDVLGFLMAVAQGSHFIYSKLHDENCNCGEKFVTDEMEEQHPDGLQKKENPTLN